MFRKTAIAIGLAMAAGGGSVMAQDSMQNSGERNAGAERQTQMSDSALRTRFDALDANGDGVLSRSEAADSEEVAEIYDSLDTSATIEDRESQSSPGGITFDQFQAGLQARGAGVVGPAVSGGQTYIIMRDGTRRLKDADGQSGGDMSQDADTRRGD